MGRLFYMLLLFCSGTTVLFAQKDYRALMQITGATEEFCISEDSTFWIATRSGNTYYSQGFGKAWYNGSLATGDKEMVSGKTFDRASFFNRDTGYVSGFIQKDGAQEIIYRTVDGGAHWDEVVFGQSSWIDANYIDFDGNAWMSGSSQLIYYSADFGAHWESFPKIEKKGNMRINTLYFENSQRGVVGGFWNRLYLTEDNCQTWQKLKTPLDQKKYKRQEENTRPKVFKVQLWGNHIIINQQGRVFYSKLDSLDWQALPNVADFQYDKHAQKLFAITGDLRVHLLDSAFSSVWVSEKKMDTRPISLQTLQGTLYAWLGNKILKVNEHCFRQELLYAGNETITEPERTAKATTKIWGAGQNDILRSDDYGKTWYRVALLPFGIGNFRALNDTQVLVSDGEARSFLLGELQGDSLVFSPYRIEKPLQNFLRYPLKEIVFEEGSKGCFHFRAKTISFKVKSDSVCYASQIEMKGYKREKKKFKHSFPLYEAIRLLQAVNENPYSKINLSELEISTKDKKKYREKINEIEKEFAKGNGLDYRKGWARYSLPYKHIDFDFFRDRLGLIDSCSVPVLNQVLGMRYGNWSTTTNWLAVSFVNENREEIIFVNTDDRGNAWYLPWIVSVGEMSFPLNNLAVSHFVEAHVSGDMFSDDVKNPWAVFQLMNYFYKLKIEESGED